MTWWAKFWQRLMGLESLESFAGIYSLGAERHSAAWSRKILYGNNGVDGLSIRLRWSDLEPYRGDFRWEKLDDLMAAADGKVMLRVLAGVYSPDWIYALANNIEVGDDRVHIPIPWDSGYLAEWGRFVRALGKRYAGHKCLRIVAITGAGAGGEMHLPGKKDSFAWYCSGSYTETALIRAWKQCIDIFREAFPRQHLSVAISRPVNFGTPEQVIYNVVKYCKTHKVGIQGNWLSAKIPLDTFVPYRVIEQYPHPVGFQMLCGAKSHRFGGSLREGLQKGLVAEASFIEIYPHDITPRNIPTLKIAVKRMKANG